MSKDCARQYLAFTYDAKDYDKSFGEFKELVENLVDSNAFRSFTKLSENSLGVSQAALSMYLRRHLLMSFDFSKRKFDI